MSKNESALLEEIRYAIKESLYKGVDSKGKILRRTDKTLLYFKSLFEKHLGEF